MKVDLNDYLIFIIFQNKNFKLGVKHQCERMDSKCAVCTEYLNTKLANLLPLLFKDDPLNHQNAHSTPVKPSTVKVDIFAVHLFLRFSR